MFFQVSWLIKADTVFLPALPVAEEQRAMSKFC